MKKIKEMQRSKNNGKKKNILMLSVKTNATERMMKIMRNILKRKVNLREKERKY